MSSFESVILNEVFCGNKNLYHGISNEISVFNGISVTGNKNANDVVSDPVIEREKFDITFVLLVCLIFSFL